MVLSLNARWLVFFYIAAASIANLIIASFGPWALWVTASILVPFDLVARDVLHERWHGTQLFTRMLLLISSGAAISYLINRNAMRIAIASCIAFLVSGLVDMIVYELAKSKSRLLKMNLSNFFSSLSDSILFPLIAFAVFDLTLSSSQLGAKFLGGAVWSVVFAKILMRNK